MKIEETSEITKAVISVMQEIEGIEKTTKVGEGSSSYNAVSDYEVKKIVRKSMIKNGLIIFPVETKTTLDVTYNEEKNNYGTKIKRSVFVSAEVRYKLVHTSGQSIELSGAGHGVDSQDKAIGKATTYALKYALLYLFLIPTGAIDDTDNTHSESIPVLPPPTVSLSEKELQDAIKEIEAAKTLDDVKTVWLSFGVKYQANEKFLKAKEDRKTALTNQK